MEVDGGVASAARRRRERRLRSWWNHEQQTVRMALSAAVHHSFDKVAAGEKYNALRGQNTDRAGTRPGVLTDPVPQEAVEFGYVAAPGPPLSTVADGHCCRDSGRPHGEVPPPGRAGGGGNPPQDPC